MKRYLWWMLAGLVAVVLVVTPRLKTTAAVSSADLVVQLFGDNTATCQLVSRVENDNLLEVEFPPPCLDEKLRLDRAIEQVKQQVNDNELMPLKVEAINYRLIDEGIRVLAELEIDYPVVGLVDFELSQQVFVSLTDGALDLRSGETEVNVNVPFFADNDLSGLLRQVVDTQLSIFNQKSLQDFLNDTSLDRRIADESGLSVEAVNFIAQSVQKNMSARIDEDAVILSIRFPDSED